MSRVLDVHTHVFPPKIAGQVLSNLKDNMGLDPVLDGTVDDLLAAMDRHGLDRCVALGAAPEPDHVDGINRFLQQVERDTIGRIIPFYTVHPHYEGMAEELGRLKNQGARGIKVHSLFQGIDPADESMFPIYEVAGDELVVLIHGGEPATPRSFRTIMDRFPDLKLVAAHFGGVDDDEEGVRELLLGRDIYFDTSLPPSVSRLGGSTVESLIHEHGHERILFGTDSPLADHGRELQFIRSLDLSDHDREGILGRNARTLIGLS